MPIKGLTDREQPRFFKKIRLGIKGEKGIPKNVDHFVIEGCDEIKKVYGDKPKILHASFPPGLPMDEAIPTWNKWYDASQFLICIGDGGSKNQPGEATWRALHNVNNIKGLTGDPGRWHNTLKRDCLGEDCADHHRRGCQRVSQIRFTLPRVNPFAIYEISTGSINTILDFQNAFRTANSLRNMGQGMGTVFNFYKVSESRGGIDATKNKKITRNYKYLTCSINDAFWDTHGDEVLAKVSQIKGFNFIEKNKDTLMQLSGVIQDGNTHIQNQITGANEEETKQIATGPLDIPTPPVKTGDDLVAKAAKTISAAADLSNDPEIIAAVSAVYQAKGKPVPKTAIANQVKKYKTKDALIEACKKAMSTVSPREMASQAKDVTPVNSSVPQGPPPPTKVIVNHAPSGVPLNSQGPSAGESLL